MLSLFSTDIVFNGSLTSGLSFTKKTNNHIQIKFKSEKKYIEIYYSDNGVGIPKDTRVKLLTTLSSQIEADFQIENRDGFYYFAKIKI